MPSGCAGKAGLLSRLTLISVTFALTHHRTTRELLFFGPTVRTETPFWHLFGVSCPFLTQSSLSDVSGLWNRTAFVSVKAALYREAVAMPYINRKSAPQVSGGRVQKKNNAADTPSYYDTPPPALVIDRQRPGKGYRHLLLQRDVETFIGLLPDWPTLSRGLNAIVLAPGEYSLNGWHQPGVVHVCAWEADLWIDYALSHYEDHKPVLDRLGVASHPLANGGVMCEFTEAQARAYQLLHILLHELGHHHDRITTRSQVRASRGESYAEDYALRHEALIWERYQGAFGVLGNDRNA